MDDHQHKGAPQVSSSSGLSTTDAGGFSPVYYYNSG